MCSTRGGWSGLVLVGRLGTRAAVTLGTPFCVSPGCSCESG